MQFQGDLIFPEIRVDFRNVIQRYSRSSPVAQCANDSKRFLVEGESAPKVGKLTINPGDVIQVDCDISPVFQQSIDL